MKNFDIKMILRSLSIVLIAEGALMSFPYLCGLIYGQEKIADAFAYTGTGLILAGILFMLTNPLKEVHLRKKDTYTLTLIGWASVCLTGAIPYFICGQGYSIAQSIFESVAGWTTTGAWSIHPQHMPESLLLWKALNNWLGEMGLMLLLFPFVPILGKNERKLTAGESKIEFENLQASYAASRRACIAIYFSLSLIEFFLLRFSPLSTYDCVINTMTSMSTAGLVNRTGQLAICYTPYIKGVITCFTIIGSLNILIFFMAVKGKFRSVAKNLELRTYFGILLLSAIIISSILILSGTYTSIPKAIGNAVVQCCSYGSTSGFWTADINGWPTPTKIILLILLFIGGCENSTGGSIKVIRFLIFMKIVKRGAYKRIHPRAVRPIKLGGATVSASSVSVVSSFVVMFFLVILAGGVLLSFENMDIESTLCASVACVTNNGTCFGVVNHGIFTDFSGFGKIMAAILMLTGKLEIYTVVMVFSRSFWNTSRSR